MKRILLSLVFLAGSMSFAAETGWVSQYLSPVIGDRYAERIESGMEQISAWTQKNKRSLLVAAGILTTIFVGKKYVWPLFYRSARPIVHNCLNASFRDHANLAALKEALRKDQLSNEQLKETGWFSNNLAHYAASLEDLDLLKELHSRDVDLGAMNTHDETPLYLAVNSGKQDIIRYIASVTRVDEKSRVRAGGTYREPLNFILQQAGKGNIDIKPSLNILIDYFFNELTSLDAVRNQIKALYSGSLENAVLRMCELPSIWKEQGRFVSNPIKGCIELLVMLGANVKAADKEGNTLLHYACKYKNGDAQRALIASGADKSARNKLGKLPSAMEKPVFGSGILPEARDTFE